MLTGIEHIDLAVADVKESIDVFQKMGFKILSRNDHHGGTAEMSLPGENQPIFDLHPANDEAAGGQLGVIHIAFKSDDLQETWDDLNRKGIVFGKAKGPHFAKGTQRNLFNLCDPDKEDSAALPGWGLYLQFVGPKGQP